MRRQLLLTVITTIAGVCLSVVLLQERKTGIVPAASAQIVAPIPQSIDYKTPKNRWWTTCPNSKNGFYDQYFQVPYAGVSLGTSGIPTLVVKGRNMDRVIGVTTNAPGYSVSLVSKTSTQVEIDIRANLSNGRFAEFPNPAASPWIWLNHAYGAVEFRIQPGIIPVYNYDNQGWGQCTWYAGIIARSQRGLTLVPSYGNGTTLSATPGTTGFPKNNSVLMAYSGSGSSGSHMAFLETITQTAAVRNKDGSTTITYKLAGSQYNASCNAARSPVDAVMVIKQVGSSYSMVTPPSIAGKTVNRVAQ